MKTKRLVLMLLFALLDYAATAETQAVAGAGRSIVTTERGQVRGTVTGTVRQFLGIPYAAPPVGSLRWRPPKAHAPWFVLRDATRFGNHCPQVAKVFGTASFSENCLFLNIFTPLDEENQQSGSRGYPVMVWIHGGALTVGENKMVRYWTEFAKSGDPNLSGVPFWHRYNATSDEFLSLVPPSPVPEFEFATDHKCDFWDTLLRSNTKGAARVSK